MGVGSSGAAPRPGRPAGSGPGLFWRHPASALILTQWRPCQQHLLPLALLLPRFSELQRVALLRLRCRLLPGSPLPSPTSSCVCFICSSLPSLVVIQRSRRSVRRGRGRQAGSLEPDGRPLRGREDSSGAAVPAGRVRAGWRGQRVGEAATHGDTLAALAASCRGRAPARGAREAAYWQWGQGWEQKEGRAAGRVSPCEGPAPHPVTAVGG